ncbi:hypothetical protein ACFLY3_03100 [Chloroflexota bacterium]
MEKTKDLPLSEKQAGEEAKEENGDLKQLATGDDNISIIKHGIYTEFEESGARKKTGAELTICNVSGSTIASALFEAVFHDKEGGTLDTVEYKAIELLPNLDRIIRINSSSLEGNKAEGYNVRLVKTTITPEPKATGNDKIEIRKHIFYNDDTSRAYAELVIKNVSNSTIATAVFEAAFYDIEGTIIDTVTREIFEYKPNTSRALNIISSIDEYNRVRGYNIKITRTTTTDVEKVQLRRHEAKTTDAGEEEINGIAKNISNIKTDAAVVANFFDQKNENIGSRVIILREIEPNTVRQFHFVFKPQEGDIVRTCTFHVGELEE